MALILADGFEGVYTGTSSSTASYLTAACSKYKYGDIAQIGTNFGRHGTGISMNTASRRLTYINPGSDSTIITGFALYNYGTAAGGYLFGICDENYVQQCALYVTATTSLLEFRRGTTTVATSSYNIVSTKWIYIEFKVYIHDSAGTYEIRVDGTTVLSGSSADTKGSTTSSLAKVLELNGYGSSNGHWSSGNYFYLDDYYIANNSGSYNNDFLGPIRVDKLFPNGDGNYSQFVGSDGNSTNNSLLVDETQLDTADYVTSATSGNKDTYAFGNISFSPTSIKAVIPTVYASIESGALDLVPVTRISGVDYEAASNFDIGINNQYKSVVLETNPATGLAWDVSGVDGAEFGFKVTT